jgi:squalene-hopene/tetraprenyl-beta-curcumene cyclase
VAACFLTLSDPLVAQQPVVPLDAKTAGPDQSLRQEVQHSIDKGLAWLKDRQNPDGSWSNADYPALTALVMTAALGDPARQGRPLGNDPQDDNLRKAHAYLMSCVHPDGSIYRKGLSNYNTCISILALVVERNPANEETLRKARTFVVGLQKHGPEGDPFDGGVGYDLGGDHSDLSNTTYAMEALYYTKELAAAKERMKDPDLDWKAATGFLERCQNLPDINKQPWASNDPANKGGFVYYPGKSSAGEMKLPDGKTALRSYGSTTYAGLLSYVYADLKKDDPRVTAAYDWLRVNYTVEENPGMGKAGLFYYYELMAKSLAAYGAGDLETADGHKIDWRHDLAIKLMNLQANDGSWQNDNARWWEKDPVLATAYSVITLDIISRRL